MTTTTTNKNWIWPTILLILIGVIIAMSFSISNLRYKNKVSNHNYEAAKSEVVKTKMKNGELLHEKQALILNEKNLLEELGLTKTELKELNKKLSDQAAYISKLEGEIRIDTVETKNDSIIYIDNTPAYVYFNYSDPWLKVKGKSNLLEKNTALYDISIPVPLTVGITKNYSIFVESANPYLNITDINAVALQDYVEKATKKKHWGFGVYAGFGAQYGIITRSFDIGPQIGVGVLYRF